MLISKDRAAALNTAAETPVSNYIDKPGVYLMRLKDIQVKTQKSGKHEGKPVLELHFQDKDEKWAPLRHYMILTGKEKFVEYNLQTIARYLQNFGSELKQANNANELAAQFKPFLNKELCIAVKISENIYHNQEDDTKKLIKNAQIWYSGPKSEHADMVDRFSESKAYIPLNEEDRAILEAAQGKPAKKDTTTAKTTSDDSDLEIPGDDGPGTLDVTESSDLELPDESGDGLELPE